MADDEDRITAGARALAERFSATTSAVEHLRIVDDAQVRTQISWLRRRRKDVWEDVLKPALKASWQRGYPNPVEHRAVAKRVAAEIAARRPLNPLPRKAA